MNVREGVLSVHVTCDLPPLPPGFDGPFLGFAPDYFHKRLRGPRDGCPPSVLWYPFTGVDKFQQDFCIYCVPWYPREWLGLDGQPRPNVFEHQSINFPTQVTAMDKIEVLYLSEREQRHCASEKRLAGQVDWSKTICAFRVLNKMPTP